MTHTCAVWCGKASQTTDESKWPIRHVQSHYVGPVLECMEVFNDTRAHSSWSAWSAGNHTIMIIGLNTMARCGDRLSSIYAGNDMQQHTTFVCVPVFACGVYSISSSNNGLKSTGLKGLWSFFLWLRIRARVRVNRISITNNHTIRDWMCACLEYQWTSYVKWEDGGMFPRINHASCAWRQSSLYLCCYVVVHDYE